MTGTPPPDVVCLGESMVTFLPTRPGRLADVPSFDRGIGGAESNVACALAALGHRARWVGRVGRDGFGDHLTEAIGAYGVDVSAVVRDPGRPTGVYFRTATDRAGAAHEVAYYRAGSAASAMGPANVPYDSVTDGRILHLTGITPALSASCLDLVRGLLARRPGRPPLVSFDVNFRPRLWHDRTEAGRVLRDLARGADLVFVGADEARELWGLTSVGAIAEALDGPRLLVVKLGRGGAVVFDRGPDRGPGSHPADGTTPADPDGTAAVDPFGTALHVRAPRVDIVAPVGAGDAFAAGFLSGTLRGLDPKSRVRLGHLTAAAALTVPGDVAVPARRARTDRLAALDDRAWERLRLGPGWTGDDQEVRTS
ncbi:2-dehydro-3-deoxygluconate kinase [Streptomyces laurentii]|uniref:2-dehydro-3-deoxygluconate kinase n=1 Tax=Streptomyces laurentii TaxID=39478 RepID=A0A169NX76_STRLU|nr:2-dehydro-3-deoxygluconate kinase [Streptomyces laurentii]